MLFFQMLLTVFYFILASSVIFFTSWYRTSGSSVVTEYDILNSFPYCICSYSFCSVFKINFIIFLIISTVSLAHLPFKQKSVVVHQLFKLKNSDIDLKNLSVGNTVRIFKSIGLCLFFSFVCLLTWFFLLALVLVWLVGFLLAFYRNSINTLFLSLPWF